MKIVIPGGSGQVGTLLARALVTDGHDVVILSRGRAAPIGRVVAWDAETLGPWVNEFDGSDVVINLAGRSVNCRYTPLNRRLIMDSRTRSTRVVGEAIRHVKQPPRVWLQASTATIYAHRYDAANDETTGILGGGEPNVPDTWKFSIDVARSWEQAANEAVVPQTRVVLMRAAMVMSPDRHGVFDTLLGLTRMGLGGTIADGRQFMSWIHERDFIRAIYWLFNDDELAGPVNLASPNPLPQTDFMRSIRHACGVRVGLPATRWMLEIGTFLMRTESELVLKSRRVIPGRLLQSGFRFELPEWPNAAQELFERWKTVAR